MHGRDPVPRVARIIIEELLEDPRASALVELAQNANELIAAFRGQHAPEPVVVEPPPAAGPSARQRLLFGEHEELCANRIRKRRAQLAALCHPDTGGNADVMAALNAAADELLAECEQKNRSRR